MKNELLFQYRFYKCIESHVFFDNFFSADKAKNAARNIESHIDRLLEIQNTNLRSKLAPTESERYFNRNGRKKTSLLKSDIEYATHFLMWVKQHHNVGAPVMLFKPAMLILGAIDIPSKHGYSYPFLKNALCPGGILQKGIKILFEDPLQITVPFPHINNNDPIGDLRERIVRSLKKDVTHDEWLSFLEIAKKFARTNCANFSDMATVGNRYIYELNAQTYTALFKRNDRRVPSEYAYLEEYCEKEETLYRRVNNEIELFQKRIYRR